MTQMSEVKVIEQDGKPAVEIFDKPNQEQPELTAESLKDAGLSEKEIELAKQNEFISQPKKDDKKDDKKENKTDDTGKKEVQRKEEIKQAAEKELSDEEEHELVSGFNKNERGLYFRQKEERKKRQAAEMERDFVKTKVKALEDELQSLKQNKAAPEPEPEAEEEIDLFEGKEDTDFMTVAEVKAYEKRKAEAAQKRAEAEKKRAEAQANAERSKLLEIDKKYTSLEDGARQRYEDFDAVMKLSKEILKDPKAVFGDDKKKLAKAISLGRALIAEFNNLDNVDPDYNATDLSYELGQLHPKYKSEEVLEGEEENLSDEKMSRLLKNSEKRKSSASVTGARRIVSTDDITLADVAKMTQEEYSKLPKDVRERLLRGK